MHENHRLSLTFDRKKADADALTVPAVLSTDAPYVRSAFTEVLQHTPNSIDLGRFPLPVIESHDANTVNVAIAENPSIQGGKLRATIRFGTSQRAQELFADIKAGVVRSLSVGYTWNTFSEQTINGEPVVNVTSWQPFEVSIVSVPADPGAGFYRSKSGEPMQTQPIEPTHQTPPAPVNNDSVADFKRQEEARKQSIRDLGPMLDRHPQIKLRAMEDMSLTAEKVGALIIQAEGEKHQPLGGFRSMDEMRVPITQFVQGGNINDAITDGLLLRSGISVKNPNPAARDFASMSIGEISRIMLRQRHGLAPSGLSNSELITRAMSTSDLPYLLENVAGKSLQAGFESVVQSHEAFVTVVQVNDFKQQSRVALSAFESLKETPELGEVTYSALTDSRETYSIASYQKAIAFSRQALINDDLSELTSVPQKLGAAARRTECDLVYSILIDNPNMADATPLFDASRGNLKTGGGSALSETSLVTAVMSLRKAKDIGNHGYLGVRPKFLIVPPELEIAALKLLASLANTKANANAIPNSDIANLQIIVEPRLTSTTAWYLIGSGVETIEVGRLAQSGSGGISYESDNDFSTDAWRMKVRLDAGAKALSPSGMVKSAGA